MCLSQEQKELLKWNKNCFSLFLKYSLLDIKKQTSKNVVDTTLKSVFSKVQNHHYYNIFLENFSYQLDKK